MKGYRLCSSVHHQGPRWIPVVFFRVRKWLPAEKAPLYISAECEACHRIKERIRYSKTKNKDPKRRRETWRLLKWEERRRKGIPERPRSAP